MFNTIVGAGAASRYGSGSDQMMRLRLRNTDTKQIRIIECAMHCALCQVKIHSHFFILQTLCDMTQDHIFIDNTTLPLKSNHLQIVCDAPDDNLLPTQISHSFSLPLIPQVHSKKK
jgi:hypothetical protein